MTRIFACLSLFFFLVPVTYIHGPPPPPNNSQVITLQPVPFHPDNKGRTRAGRLEFLGGWALSSENDSFGAISAMTMLEKNRLLMLSDAGLLIGFTLDEKNNRAVRPFIAPLPDGPEPDNEHSRRNWDAEAMVADMETGQFWVGFEFSHELWRYGRSFARKEAGYKVPIMQQWPSNGGAEAMLKLTDGRFLVFSESADYAKGGHQALIFDGDPTDPETKITTFGYRPPKGYKITDAALLPDGKALILHRRFSVLTGISAILSIGDLDDIESGKVWTSARIAELKSPFTVDNMEALAVTQDGDDTIIWMASDDNFLALQKSLLMKFRLLSGKTKRKKSTTGPQKEKAGAKPGFSSLPENQADE